jgi:8-oxo-dGTP diphosphatase
MKHYVLGFAFSKDRKEIILIEKQKPDWQKGKLNGVGGKVEKKDFAWNTNGEVTPYVATIAMQREFKEETGVETQSWQWNYFGKMIFNNDIMGGGAMVHLLRMFDDVIQYCETKEEEEILRVNTDTCLDVYDCMHNLPILIPLALSTEFKFTELSD